MAAERRTTETGLCSFSGCTETVLPKKRKELRNSYNKMCLEPYIYDGRKM